MADYDVIVLGAGHAGMMTATYLARAGLDVVILEKDLEVGGDMCTESFAYPGYWHNLHSYYHLGVDRLPPFRDLGFERFHADYVTPDPQNALLLEDGRTLFGWLNPEKTADSIAVVSAKDGDTVRDVNRRLGRFLREQVIPALYGGSRNGGNGSDPAAGLGDSLEAREVGEFRELTARDAAERLFDDPAVRAFYLNQLPITRGLRDDVPGLGHVVLLAVAQAESMMLLIEGGPHVMAHALWRAMVAAEGETRTVCDVRRIVVENGRATGVELADGTRLNARKCVIGALGLEEVFLELVGKEHLPSGLAEGIGAFHSAPFGILSVHLALEGSVSYKGRPAELTRTFKVDLGPQSPEGWTELWAAADEGRLPEPVCLSAGIPTVYDSLHAPDGGNTVVLWAPVPYRMGDRGVDGWDDVKDSFRDAAVERFKQVVDLSRGNILDARRSCPPPTSSGTSGTSTRARFIWERSSIGGASTFLPFRSSPGTGPPSRDFTIAVPVSTPAAESSARRPITRSTSSRRTWRFRSGGQRGSERLYAIAKPDDAPPRGGLAGRGGGGGGARIEFEHLGGTFRDHGRDPFQRDRIVCRARDEADRPIEVVELRTMIVQPEGSVCLPGGSVRCNRAPPLQADWMAMNRSRGPRRPRARQG